MNYAVAILKLLWTWIGIVVAVGCIFLMIYSLLMMIVWGIRNRKRGKKNEADSTNEQ